MYEQTIYMFILLKIEKKGWIKNFLGGSKEEDKANAFLS